MNKILICSCLLLSFMAATAQRNESAFGISAGINNYIPRPGFVSARPDIGYSLGVLSAFKVTKQSDAVIEFGFTRFRMDFYGKEVGESTNSWQDFSNSRLYGGAIYYYDLFANKERNLIFGVHGGLTATYINNFVVKGGKNAYYTLEPYTINGLTMEVSRYNNDQFNFFGSLGINMYYNFMELNLRYNLGLTSPYDVMQYKDERIDFSGKDDFISLTFTYYLHGDK